jgi:hypothetical protein
VPRRIREVKGEDLLELELHREDGALGNGDQGGDGRQDGRRAGHAQDDRAGLAEEAAEFGEGAAERFRVGRVARDFVGRAQRKARTLPFEDRRPEPGGSELNADAYCHGTSIARAWETRTWKP